MKKGQWRDILAHSIWFFAALLLLLMTYRDRFVAPEWLGIVGRLHPVLVHLPLVFALLFVVCAFRDFGERKAIATDTSDWLLLATGSGMVTALAGLFLSKEPGYDAEALEGHLLGGILLPGWLWVVYGMRKVLLPPWIMVGALITGGLLIFTGHGGGVLTHGSDFLTMPAAPTASVAFTEENTGFEVFIQPILKAKCYSCHHSSKAKGGLDLTSVEKVEKGGKNGDLFEQGKNGLLWTRLHLPEPEKEHMPPAGKSQLTGEERNLLEEWILNRPAFDVPIQALEASDAIRQAAETRLQATKPEPNDFDAAAPALVTKLNNPGRRIAPVAQNAPALAATLFNPQQFQSGQLSELLAIAPQLTELTLTRMPLTASDFELVSQFPNLKKLNMNETPLLGQHLKYLGKLKRLHSLAISGTRVSASDLLDMQLPEALRALYCWNTQIRPEDLPRLRGKFPGIRFETGFPGDEEPMKLSPPVLKNEETVLLDSVQLQVKHYVKGAEIRFTTDGTDPDSLTSAVFKPGIIVDRTTRFKFRAFKQGWIGSEVLDVSFFRNSVRVDTVIFLAPVDKQYASKGASALYDLKKGDINFRSPEWLGYRENPMEALISFAKATSVSNVTLSNLVDINSFIMPPRSVEVWGGMEPGKLTLLNRIVPEQPQKSAPVYLSQTMCNFRPQTVRYLKIVASNVTKLPTWHPGKGDRGWVFVDEVFLN